MPSTPSSLLSYLRVVAAAWRNDPRNDAELLVRFAQSRDEAAFAALVSRHGPLVWRTCRCILGDTPDAEDAFQATFLALARKASRVTIESPAGWLHRVARQAAIDVRSKPRRSQDLGQQLWAVTQPPAEEETSRRELYEVLDKELAGLPERLRVPLLLHYLEGKSQVEVAHLLGCSRGAVQRRLAKGEAILRKRLMRRGLEIGVGSVAVLLGDTVGASAMPARLIGSTARAAVAFRSGTLSGGAAEAARTVLGAIPASIERTIMRKSLWIMLACICSLGVGLAAWQASSAHPEAVESSEASASPKAAAEPGTGQVDCFGDPLPQGALARLGTVRLRHGGTAISRTYRSDEPDAVVFSQDGKVLITAGGTNPIRVWDAATSKLLRSFGGGGGYDKVVWFIALSPDGKTLAVVYDYDGGGSLWEVATGKRLHPLENSIFALAFSRDGRTLRSVSRDYKIRVWEVATGKVLNEDREQPLQNAEKVVGSNVSFPRFSPDGETLASINKNNIVHLWEAASGKELCHLPLGKGSISAERSILALSSDSRFLAVSSNLDDGAVHLWEVATGKEVRKWIPDKTGTRSLAFSPDGKLLATGSGFGPIRLWEMATGKQLRQCQGYRAHVVGLAFSPDGTTLASLAGLNDHTTRLWEVASGKERLRPSGGHVGSVLSVAFSADGKRVISGGRDGLVGLWNAETGQKEGPLLRAGDFQALAALAPDGKTVLTIGNSFAPNGYPNVMEVVFKAPSVVCVWDRATGQKLRQFKGFEGAPQSLALSLDGKVLLWNSLTRVYLMEVATGKTILEFPDTQNKWKSTALSPDGKILAIYVGEGDGEKATVYFHKTATGKGLGSIQAPGARSWCLALSPDGQTFALGGVRDKGKNYPIRLWRAQRGKNDWKEAQKLFGHGDEVWGLTFSPDGKTLASTSRDGTLRLWEVATGRERRRFAGHSGAVWCLAFAPDGRRLAAGGDDTTILVWDVTGRLDSGQLRPGKLSDQQVKKLWADLAGADAARAGQAVWTLAAAPAQAIPLLREHLRPAAPAGKRIVRLIADLDSDTFAVRQKAVDELAKLGEDAELALRQALAKSTSLEMRRRLEQLLEPLEKEFHLSDEQVRFCRALEVLGQIGTPEALQLLESLAGGAPEARQTLEAQAILKRLRTRAKAAQP